MYKKKSMKKNGNFESLMMSEVSSRHHVSPSSSFSRGFCSSDEYLSSPEDSGSNGSNGVMKNKNRFWMESEKSFFEQHHQQQHVNGYNGGHVNNNINGFSENVVLDYQLGLSENLSTISIQDEYNNSVARQQFHNCPGFSILPYGFEQNESYDRVSSCSVRGFDGEVKHPAFFGFQEGCRSGNTLSAGSSYFTTHHNQSNGVYSHLREQGLSQCYSRGGIQSQSPVRSNSNSRPYFNDAWLNSRKCGLNSSMENGLFSPINSAQLMQYKLGFSSVGNHPYYDYQGLSECYSRGGIQSQSPVRSNSNSRPYFNDAWLNSRKCGLNYSMENGLFSPINSAQLMQYKLGFSSVGNHPYYDYSVSRERTRGFPSGRVSQSSFPAKGWGEFEAFGCEDSFILHRDMNFVMNKKYDRSSSQKKNLYNETAQNMRERRLELDIRAQSRVSYENGPSPLNCHPQSVWTEEFGSLADVRGYLYFIAKDQNGCRFLQNMVDQGTRQDVQVIFDEVIDHVVELMTNPFGNYLMQKLLDACNEEQRLQIVRMVTAEPGQLVKISLNTHGTRVVQKLIETLKTRQQISAVVLALQTGFLELIKDLNGNHVVQRCLQFLNHEDNKFIFDAATKFCVDIATHRHGCCVLQRCIAHSTGDYREKLIAEVSANALLLAQDAFGNYVVQYVLEMKIPSVMAKLNSQFEGNYVHLSTQKFSSHVVEKCLKFCEDSRAKIIHELVSVHNFEQLLQDPFANYVIQSALEATEGAPYNSLTEAVSQYTLLKTSPYCKRIFSRNLLKK